MLKKIIMWLILVPIVLILAMWIVDLGLAMMSGEMDLVSWLQANRVLFAVIITYLIFRYANPFKKDSGE